MPRVSLIEWGVDLLPLEPKWTCQNPMSLGEHPIILTKLHYKSDEFWESPTNFDLDLDFGLETPLDPLDLKCLDIPAFNDN